MTKFFDSDIVRKEFKEMFDLQERLQKVFFKLPMLSHEEKVEFISLVKILVEKQEIMYFRMKLSDDPDSQEMIEQIRRSAISLGISPDRTVDQMFKDMKQSIDTLMKTLDMRADP